MMGYKCTRFFDCPRTTPKLPALFLSVLSVLGMSNAAAAGTNSEIGIASDNVVAEGVKAPFKYPPTPYLFGLGEQYFWFGLPYPSITAAEDWVPDPNIHYLGVTTVALIRLTSSIFGPYDLFALAAYARVKNGAPALRIMQEYTSVEFPEGYPPQIPIKTARFEWKQQASGGMDVKIFYPPNATVPVADFTGIYKLPLSVPLGNTTALGPLIQDFFTCIQTVRNASTGEISSNYVRTSFSYTPEATLVAYTTLSSPSGKLNPWFSGVIPIGPAFTGGGFGVSVDPYIPSD